MSDKTMIPLTIILTVVVGGITACLIAGVPIVNLIAAFGLVGSIGGAIGSVINHVKLVKVETQTNGINAEANRQAVAQQIANEALMREFIEYAKTSTPAKVE
jgi:hypothetical protein